MALALAAADATSPAFQIRLIQDTAGADTEEMTSTRSTADPNRTVKETVHVQRAALLDHTAVASATVQKDAVTGKPQIEVVFSERGRKLFADITREKVGRRLAMVVDGQLSWWGGVWPWWWMACWWRRAGCGGCSGVVEQ
jgi:preprotein translocase subunit SecD